MKLNTLHRAGLLTTALGLAFGATAQAQEAPRIIVNGDPLRTRVAPVVENNRVLVPLRAIFEELGATVNYDRRDGTILARRRGTDVRMEVNSTRAEVNGRVVRLDVPATTYGGSTMVPLRFVSEALGAQVDFDTYRNRVAINDRNWRDRPGNAWDDRDRPGRGRGDRRDDRDPYLRDQNR